MCFVLIFRRVLRDQHPEVFDGFSFGVFFGPTRNGPYHSVLRVEEIRKLGPDTKIREGDIYFYSIKKNVRANQ